MEMIPCKVKTWEMEFDELVAELVVLQDAVNKRGLYTDKKLQSMFKKQTKIAYNSKNATIVRYEALLTIRDAFKMSLAKSLATALTVVK